MYRCELCNVVVPSGTPAEIVVVETRPTEYPSRPKAHKHRVGRKMKHSDDPGGAGYEIAREAKACARCAAEFRRKLATEAEAEAGFAAPAPAPEAPAPEPAPAEPAAPAPATEAAPEADSAPAEA